MGIMQLLNLILFWVFLGYLASFIAKRRGGNPITWFFLGLFLGVLGVLLAWLVPKNKKKKSPPSLPTAPQRSESWLKMWYYLDPSQQQCGPIEFPDFIKLHKEKQICEKSYVWGEGMKEWRQLGQLPDLIQEINNQA